MHEARAQRPVGRVEVDRAGLEAVRPVAGLQGGEVNGRGVAGCGEDEGYGGERRGAHGNEYGGKGGRV